MCRKCSPHARVPYRIDQQPEVAHHSRIVTQPVSTQSRRPRRQSVCRLVSVCLCCHLGSNWQTILPYNWYGHNWVSWERQEHLPWHLLPSEQRQIEADRFHSIGGRNSGHMLRSIWARSSNFTMGAVARRRKEAPHRYAPKSGCVW